MNSPFFTEKDISFNKIDFDSICKLFSFLTGFIISVFSFFISLSESLLSFKYILLSILFISIFIFFSLFVFPRTFLLIPISNSSGSCIEKLIFSKFTKIPFLSNSSKFSNFFLS